MFSSRSSWDLVLCWVWRDSGVCRALSHSSSSLLLQPLHLPFTRNSEQVLVRNILLDVLCSPNGFLVRQAGVPLETEALLFKSKAPYWTVILNSQLECQNPVAPQFRVCVPCVSCALGCLSPACTVVSFVSRLGCLCGKPL